MTVPAYFGEQEKQASKDACDIAGLICSEIITEPVAAALAFGRDHAREGEKKTFMVYDFGGGTLDVTILELLNRQYKVKTIKGNDHLGGQDFDVKILEWAIEEWNG